MPINHPLTSNGELLWTSTKFGPTAHNIIHGFQHESKFRVSQKWAVKGGILIQTLAPGLPTLFPSETRGPNIIYWAIFSDTIVYFDRCS